MANEVLVPELSWLLTLLCLALIVILIAMCICPKQTESRSHEYGTAGRLSMTRDSPIFQHQNASNGSVISVKCGEDESLEEDGSLKRNSWTVKDRALPDIPNVNSVSPNTVLPCAEDRNDQTVESTNLTKKKTHKHTAPKPPVFDSSVKDVSSDKVSRKDQSHIMTITVNDKNLPLDADRPSSSGTFKAHPWSQVIDCVPCTSDGSVILKKVGNPAPSSSSPSRRLSDSDAYNYDSGSNPYAEPHVGRMSQSSSPVCIHINASNNSVEHESVVTPAGLAVAGAVPSSDIPYMTPPLLHNPLPGTSSEESPQRNSLVPHSEVPYTVISVREPLARVREMTLRKQRIIQQNSAEGENHYAMVPEEEQMYAEIGSGQDSGSSSITYAHIEPRELPPVPPTVESLKSVAHAHSRQASTVSNSSFGSCISGSLENTSPTQLRNPSSYLYSAVEKNGKQRRTIHIAEGASIISTMDKHKKVEDLYAKVRKKRVELTLSASSSEEYSGYQGITGDDSECTTPPPSPWASTTPPAPPPITGRLQAASLGVLSSTNNQHIRRHSADPNLAERIKEVEVLENKHTTYLSANNNGSEPGYEQIYNNDNANDSCYEKIKDECIEEGENKIGYESILHSDNSCSFPGYASVKDPDKDSSDPGYECVAQIGNDSISSDPGYEPVRISLHLDEADSNHGYTTVNLGDDAEPNYETVKKLYRTESDAVDPGYEKVKKLARNDSDASDPGYERVHNKIEESTDPGYETVHRSDSDNEPGYEIVRHHNKNTTTSELTKDPCTSFSKQNSFNSRAPTSTVLFVSGDSQPNMTNEEQISKDVDDMSSELDTNATFL